MKIIRIVFLVITMIFLASIASAAVDYTVKPGDTLSRICYKVLGNGAQKTWEEEASRLGISNPHLIYPGQKFSFPHIRFLWAAKTGHRGHGSWMVIPSAKWKMSAHESVRRMNKESRDGIVYSYEELILAEPVSILLRNTNTWRH